MKGYFSRIIQQTGINIDSGGKYGRDSYGITQTMAEDANEIPSFHIEESKLTPPLQNSRSNPLHPEGSEQYSKDKNMGEQPPHESDIHTSKQEKSEEENRDSQKIKVKTDEMDDEMTLDRELGKKEWKVKKTEESDKTDFQSQKGVASKGNILFEINEEYTQKSGAEPEINQPDQTIRGNTKSPSMKDIRNWVAVTPAPEEMEPTNLNQETFPQPPHEPIIDEDKQGTDLPQDKVNNLQKKELEIQKNQISIGTIQLTVEEPQDNLPGASLMQKSRYKTDNKENKNNASRLSRHYIRIR